MYGLTPAVLADLAQRWRLREVCVFGSVARGEEGPGSDIDLLVEFEDEADWSLLDVARLQGEIEDLTSRPVDLVERAALVNPYRRRSVTRDARLLYGPRRR